MLYGKQEGFPIINITAQHCPQSRAEVEELLENLKKDWLAYARQKPSDYHQCVMYHYEHILYPLARYGSPEVLEIVYRELNKDVLEAVFGSSLASLKNDISNLNYTLDHSTRCSNARKLYQYLAQSKFNSESSQQNSGLINQLYWQEYFRFDILVTYPDLFDNIKKFSDKIESIVNFQPGKSGLFLYALKNSSFAGDSKARIQVIARYSDYLKQIKPKGPHDTSLGDKAGREQRHKDILKIAIQDVKSMWRGKPAELYANKEEYSSLIKVLDFVYREIASEIQKELKNYDENALETLEVKERVSILRSLAMTFSKLHQHSVENNKEDVSLIQRTNYCYHIAMKIAPQDEDLKHAYYQSLENLFLKTKDDKNKIDLMKRYTTLGQELGINAQHTEQKPSYEETIPSLETERKQQPQIEGVNKGPVFQAIKSALLSSKEFNNLENYAKNHKYKKNQINDYVKQINSADDLTSLRNAIEADPRGEKYSMRENTAFLGTYAFFHHGEQSTSDSYARRLAEKLEEIVKEKTNSQNFNPQPN